MGTGNIIAGNSRDPRYSRSLEQVTDIDLTGDDSSVLSWSIIAMSGSESVGITGTGEINASSIGTMRLR